MSMPRGLSIIYRNAYEYTLLMKLGIEIPDHRHISRMAVFADAYDPIRDKRCEDAAMMINRYLTELKGMPKYRMDVQPSNRGRNYSNYVLQDPASHRTLLLEVMIAENETGADYSEQRFHLHGLLCLLGESLRQEERDIIEGKWNLIKEFIAAHEGQKWKDLQDERRKIYKTTKDILKETAQMLYLNGSGLTPCLWNHLYGMPILRCIFAKHSTYLQMINPIEQFNPEEAEIVDKPGGTTIIEKFDNKATKVRVLTSINKVTFSSLLAAISFNLRDEQYTCGWLEYNPDIYGNAFDFYNK